MQHSPSSLTLRIPPQSINYEAFIGVSIITDPAFFSFCHSLSMRLAVIVSAPLVEVVKKNLLPKLGEKTELIILPGGELVKSREWKEKIEDILIEKKYGRDSCLLAIGGGALLDVVGFVAATYCRGIPYISLPTTLIAMTDASIGGKTSVNVPLAKNFIGAFHHPLRIYMDIEFLTTLPIHEYRAGLAETIKHALIGSESLFHFLEDHFESILAKKEEILQEMIQKSCQVKKTIVEQDPFEKGEKRALLNFGHTVGHALEKLSGYTLRHGDAVAAGMWLEAWMAKEQGMLPSKDFERMNELFCKVPFSLSPLQQLSSQPLDSLFGLDKKAKGGVPYVVSLRKIGDAFLTPLDEDILQKGILHALCCH